MDQMDQSNRKINEANMCKVGGCERTVNDAGECCKKGRSADGSKANEYVNQLKRTE